jgi:hypothetical protein
MIFCTILLALLMAFHSLSNYQTEVCFRISFSLDVFFNLNSSAFEINERRLRIRRHSLHANGCGRNFAVAVQS